MQYLTFIFLFYTLVKDFFCHSQNLIVTPNDFDLPRIVMWLLIISKGRYIYNI